MIALGIDIETTGLDPQNDEITEVGLALFDMTDKKLLMSQSFLVQGVKSVPPEIVELTGITTLMREKAGFKKAAVKDSVTALLGVADYLCAHNAEFEKSFLGDFGMKWIDTACDLPIPKRITTRKLEHLACEHKIYVKDAHRALPDVLTMLELLGRYPEVEVLELANSPTLQVRALTGYEQRELAKARGYRWDGERKYWVKPVKGVHLDQEMAACKVDGFDVVVL